MPRFFLVLLSALFLGLPLSWAQHPAIQQMVDAVHVDSLMWRMERLSGDVPVNVGQGDTLILSRHKSKPGNIVAAQWISQEFTRMGYTPVQEHFGATGANLLAVKAGMLHPERKVVICAHYDCMPGVAVAPGADDDGSGTCAVLEAARVMAPFSFENTVVFALWDEEEQGMVGSAYHAGNALGNNEQIIGVVDMDAIAYDGNGDGLMRIHARPVGNSMAIKDSALMVNNLYGLGVSIIVNTPGATYSDHASFWNQGYGAILVIEDFDNDPNPHYHTPNDRLAYLDTGYWRGLTRLAIGTTAALAVPTASMGVGSSPALRMVDVLELSPNPTRGMVEVHVNSPREAKALLLISDAMGRTVQQWVMPAEGRLHVDLRQLPSGAYYVRYAEGGYTVTKQLVLLP